MEQTFTAGTTVVSAALAALTTVRDPELDEPVTTLGFVASCSVSRDGRAEVRLGHARPARHGVDGRFEGGRAGEHSPDDGRLAGGGPDGDQFANARPGRDGPARWGMTACGHHDVSWPSPRHRAPTASVDAPISFTYHLPL